MPKILDVHMIDPATVALITETDGIHLFGLSEADTPTEWIQLDVEGAIQNVAAVGRHFLVHREDGRVIKMSLSCGEEAGFMGSAPGEGADAGMDQAPDSSVE